MTKQAIAAAMVVLVACGSSARTQTAQPPTGTLDQLLAPIALYPDSLLAQMLMSATDPAKVTELDKWLKSNAKLKGTQLQDAAVKAGFEASFVALVLFPKVVSYMAEQIAWTRVLGQAFTSDRTAVFASIQKLRKQAQSVGSLKSTPQQEVETKTTSAGEQVIVIEPTNPQIVYVPQYNTEVVYTQAPTTSTVIIQEDDDDAEEAIAAGLMAFTVAATCTTTRGTTTTTTGKMRAKTTWITAKTWPRNAAIGWRTGARTGRTAWRIHRSNAPIGRRTEWKTGPTRRPNEPSGPHRRKAPRNRARAGVVPQPRKLAAVAAGPALSQVVNEPARMRSRAIRAATRSVRPAPADSEAAAAAPRAAAVHAAAGAGDDQRSERSPHEDDEVVCVGFDGGSVVDEPCVRAARKGVRLA
jgi:hypothetical protein